MSSSVLPPIGNHIVLQRTIKNIKNMEFLSYQTGSLVFPPIGKH